MNTMQKTVAYFKKYTSKISLDFDYFSIEDFEVKEKDIKNIIDYLELLQSDFSAKHIDLYYLSNFYENDYFNLSRFLWYATIETSEFQLDCFTSVMY